MGEKETNKGQNPFLNPRVLVALITVIGGILTVYLQVVRPKEIDLSATQTAEARQTQIAALPTVTSTRTAVPSSNSSPNPTSTFTLVPKTTRLPTLTPTWTPTPCPQQGKTVTETLTNLINSEAHAAETKDYGLIQSIFAQDAVIRDRQNDPDASKTSKVWTSPRSRYLEDLFVYSTIRMATHFEMMPVGKGIAATKAWFVSGSKGEWRDSTGAWPTYENRSKTDQSLGSDHWTFAKNVAGCWVIVEYDFNAGHIQFPLE